MQYQQGQRGVARTLGMGEVELPCFIYVHTTMHHHSQHSGRNILINMAFKVRITLPYLTHDFYALFRTKVTKITTKRDGNEGRKDTQLRFSIPSDRRRFTSFLGLLLNNDLLCIR